MEVTSWAIDGASSYHRGRAVNVSRSSCGATGSSGALRARGRAESSQESRRRGEPAARANALRRLPWSGDLDGSCLLSTPGTIEIAPRLAGGLGSEVLMSGEGGIVLPTGCRLHVDPSPSGKRWHAWCDCGWNQIVPKGQTGSYRFDISEQRAEAHAIWHARRGVVQQAKQDIAHRVNGGSATWGTRSA